MRLPKPSASRERLLSRLRMRSMGKLISQAEREALLSGVHRPLDARRCAERPPSGPPKRAVPYDFKHHNRVSADQLRKLEDLHDAFATRLSGSLSALWRTVVDIVMLSVEQITYTEFVSSLKSPSCTYTFKLDPLPGPGLLDIDPGLAFALVERLFGGRGSATEIDRELTRIERGLMQRLAASLLAQLESSWKHVFEVRAQGLNFEANPQIMQMVPPGETVIVASLQLDMPGSGGLVTLVYPYVTLEPLLLRLATAHRQSPANNLPAGRHQDAARQLAEVEVSVRALLGDLQLPLADLLSLKTDTVLNLPVRPGDLVTVQVEGRSKYLATLGQVGRRRALRIEHSHVKEA